MPQRRVHGSCNGGSHSINCYPTDKVNTRSQIEVHTGPTDWTIEGRGTTVEARPSVQHTAGSIPGLCDNVTSLGKMFTLKCPVR